MADLQIGPHGGTLTVLPAGGRAAVPTMLTIGGTQTSLAGADTMDVVGRKWQTVWTWRNSTVAADVAAIVAWATGSHGPGPFDVIAPEIDELIGAVDTVRVMNIAAFDPGGSGRLGLWSPSLTLKDAVAF